MQRDAARELAHPWLRFGVGLTQGRRSRNVFEVPDDVHRVLEPLRRALESAQRAVKRVRRWGRADHVESSRRANQELGHRRPDLVHRDAVERDRKSSDRQRLVGHCP